MGVVDPHSHNCYILLHSSKNHRDSLSCLSTRPSGYRVHRIRQSCHVLLQSLFSLLIVRITFGTIVSTIFNLLTTEEFTATTTAHSVTSQNSESFVCFLSSLICRSHFLQIPESSISSELRFPHSGHVIRTTMRSPPQGNDHYNQYMTCPNICRLSSFVLDLDSLVLVGTSLLESSFVYTLGKYQTLRERLRYCRRPVSDLAPNASCLVPTTNLFFQKQLDIQIHFLTEFNS